MTIPTIGTIENLLKEDPECHLVSEVKEPGFRRRRRTWVRISSGRLVVIYKVSKGMFGEDGRSVLPCNVSPEDAEEYLRDRGVTSEDYARVIEPALASSADSNAQS